MRSIELLALAIVAAFAWFDAARAASPPEPPSPAQLEALDAEVRGYVERDEAVSAELVVLSHGEKVWHSVHGLADRESKRALAKDQIHCIRSMTKTLVGTAVQILVDEGKLSLDDPAAKWLPNFGHGKHASITVRHLLEHVSGLPLTSILGKDPRQLTSIDVVVDLAAKEELLCEPGTDFNYSDNGADALTAIIAAVAKAPAEEYIQARILDPLGMKDTFLRAPEDRSRILSAYSGTAGSWTRFWSPRDAPLFACFLGSQAAYSTAADYAKLLALWRNDGMVGQQRLLSHAAVERGLRIANVMPYPTGLTGTRSGYGQLWMLWVEGEGADERRVAFGHGGSDGTMAWCFPERDLTILYFTQSRGGQSILLLEAAIDRILFGHQPPERDIAPIQGWWWSPNDAGAVRISTRNAKPTLDVPGRFSLSMKPSGEPGGEAWTFDLDPSTTIVPERDESRAIVALQVRTKDKLDRWTRFAPAKDLPTVDQVVGLVRKAHGLGPDGFPFPIERIGTIDIPNLKRHLDIVQRFEGLRLRSDNKPSSGSTSTVVSDGAKVWSIAEGQSAQEITGEIAAQILLEHPGRLFGDWRKHFASVEVLAVAADDEGRRIIHVWCGANTSPPIVLHVEESSGLVVGMERVVSIPGLGPVGVSTVFSDFRPITRGERTVTLPFHARGEFTSALLGVAETKLVSFTTPESFPPGTFEGR